MQTSTRKSANHLIFLLCASLLQVAGTFGQSISVISNIKAWQHPTKKVFSANDISIKKVVIVNKVKPIFYVELPFNAAVCDTEGFEIVLKELLKANSYWSFRVMDSTQKETKLIVDVIGDPRSKAMVGISYVKKNPCESDFKYHRILETSDGHVDIYDISKNADRSTYRLAFAGKEVRFSEEGYSFQNAKKIPQERPKSDKTFFLLNFSGPGLNCHDHYRIFEVQAGRGAILSEPFGNCTDLSESILSGDTLRLKMQNSLDDSQKEEYMWSSGHFINLR